MAALLCRLSSRIQRTFVTTALRACSSDSSGPPKNTSANVTKDEGHRPADLAGHKKVTLEQFYEDLNYRTEPHKALVEKLPAWTDQDGMLNKMKRDCGAYGDPFNHVYKITRKEKNRGYYMNPTLIPTTTGKRIIGCICEKDDDEIVWQEFQIGNPQSCRCGYWFELVYCDLNDGTQDDMRVYEPKDDKSWKTKFDMWMKTPV